MSSKIGPIGSSYVFVASDDRGNTVTANQGGGLLLTGATGGFLYVPGMTGAPSSASGPTGYTGTVAHVFDVSNNMPWYLNSVNTFGGSTGGTPSWVAGNGQVLIQKIVLGGVTGTVTFNNIPQVFNHLRLMGMGEVNQAGVDNFGFRIGVNGGAVITTGYDLQTTYSTNATAAGSALPNVGSWAGPKISGNGNGSPGLCDTLFPWYTLTTFNKCYSSSGGAVPQTVGEQTTSTGSCRSSTGAITSIAVVVYSNPGVITYLTGSAFALYGVW